MKETLTNRELYLKIRDLLLWLYEKKRYHDFRDLANGMALDLKFNVPMSADPNIWADWEQMGKEKIPINEAFEYLKSFIQLYTKKYEAPVLNNILDYFIPDDILYEKEVELKWNEIINN
jgi:hypothetical protein